MVRGSMFEVGMFAVVAPSSSTYPVSDLSYVSIQVCSSFCASVQRGAQRVEIRLRRFEGIRK